MRLFGKIAELTQVLFRKNSNEITVEPGTNTGASGNVSFTLPEEVGPSSHELVTLDSSQSLTEKSIDFSIATNDRVLNIPRNTKSNLDALTRSAGALLYDTDNDVLYIDNGSSLVLVGQSLVVNETLAASTSTTIIDVAYSGSENMIIKYSLKEATTNSKRVGQLFITTDGTTVSVADSNTETAAIDVEFSASITGGTNIELEAINSSSNSIDMNYFLDSWSD